MSVKKFLQNNFLEITTKARNPIFYPSLLFLTLSNIGFVLPILLAIYRKLYIEALVYFYNMFFSAVNVFKLRFNN